MTRTIEHPASPARAKPTWDGASAWLRTYYFTRASVAALWAASAFTVGRTTPPAAVALLVAYPAWDAIANFADAGRNGGLKNNLPQATNVFVSGAAAIAVLAESNSMNAVLGVFGAWAILAGLLQLVTGLRRWKAFGAQWAMILSGAQSGLAGAFFLKVASGPKVPTIMEIAPYAVFGAIYFLVSALWLTIKSARARSAARSA